VRRTNQAYLTVVPAKAWTTAVRNDADHAGYARRSMPRRIARHSQRKNITVDPATTAAATDRFAVKCETDCSTAWVKGLAAV
jgi:hypothetical protein